MTVNGKIFLVYGKSPTDMNQLLQLRLLMPQIEHSLDDGNMTISQYCPKSNSFRDIDQKEMLPYFGTTVSDTKVYRVTEDDEDDDEDRTVEVLDLAVNEQEWKIINDENCSKFGDMEMIDLNGKSYAFGIPACVYNKGRGKRINICEINFNL